MKPCSRARPEQRLALGAAQRVAGRVLEVGDDVRELRLDAAVDQRRDAVDVDAVGLELDHADVGEALAQREQRAVVGRALDDHDVAGLDELVEQEGVRLHRAVGDDHLRGLDAVLLGDPGAQRGVADRGAVGRRAAGVVGERAGRGLLEPFDVDDVQRWCSAGERDRVGGHGLKGKRPRRARRSAREQVSEHRAGGHDEQHRRDTSSDPEGAPPAPGGLQPGGRLVVWDAVPARRPRRAPARARLACAGSERWARAGSGSSRARSLDERLIDRRRLRDRRRRRTDDRLQLR